MEPLNNTQTLTKRHSNKLSCWTTLS